MKARLPLIALVLTLASTTCSTSPDFSIEKRIRRVERGLLNAYGDPPWKGMRLAERMKHHNVPGASIAVINDYQVEWTRGYGVLAADKGESVSPDTLFQTASIAKPVVAVAALHFVERGDFELDGDVNHSLVSWKIPENKYTADDKVTLRRLLSHTAGVTVEGFRGYSNGEKVPNLRQILNGEWPANSPPIRVDIVPGTQHRYSGGGYMIVQQLVEDVVGEPFSVIMRNSVLEPLGMSTSTFESPLPEQLRIHAASGHRADGSTIPGGWHTYPEMGAGASMWSTPSDMARFAVEMMKTYVGQSNGVLSHTLAVQMLTPQIENRGLGPLVYDEGGDRFYFMHPGGNDGYKSVLVAYPRRGQGVVIMTNGDNGEALWHEILRSVSVEYGWVRNNSYLYAGITAAIVVALGMIPLLRRMRARGYPYR